ncbi:MAG TPA: DUF58 domain-containing protein [Gemmatimonadaceae bacterium]|nr:DUF58 domain-containing protein [Gemmatimonadaceae bacterium]
MHIGRARDETAGTMFIDPKVLAKIDNLELLARTVVEGFINGLHRSPNLGASMDFAEHRAYMPGDDLRRIDWRLFGRSDRYFVKEFEADTNTNLLILLDISASMGFASGAVSKLQYAKFLASCLAYFSSRQRDRVGLVTFADAIVDYVPPAAKHLNIVLQTIARATPQGQGSLDAPLNQVAEHARRRQIVVLISDLYDEPERIVRAVARLRNRGNDLIVLHVLDPAELDLPFDDAANFEDMETGEAIPVVPGLLRDQYRTLVADHTATLARLMREERIDYALFNTSQPLDHALFAYLADRQRLSRTR